MTTLHSDDPEMTTPIQAKSSAFFLTNPQREPFLRAACEALLFLIFHRIMGKRCFGLLSSYTAIPSVLFCFLFLFTLGSDADLVLNRPGFCGISQITLTVLTSNDFKIDSP